ncbi:uncharacterized protein [Nicotiana tomentosiformis]|uniref:uncharacterized protein n=1 Tax=Nicotiana tomentosiformis TaxID=4098 RepID=UPI00388C5CA2
MRCDSSHYSRVEDLEALYLRRVWKANMVADALSRKAESMGSLAFIPVRQYDDPHLLVIKDTVQLSDSKEVTIGDDGVLRMQSRICVLNVDGLRELILEEAHSSHYSIDQGTTKMYHDLKQHYWWRRMKKDIMEYVARCLKCQ